ncbi:Alpha/Beta hydrolase protein [Phlyctochytrium arcticum]|nr:Alpha/Beta hydrolase protein [Phlyctochytrium arcticum]
MDTKACIEYWKYPCETHTTETRDGYRLGLHRIPNPQFGSTAYSYPPPYERPPIIIWHGLFIQSGAFVCSPGGPTTNLAFVLADAGFDVWLANSRGSVYSRHHAHLPSAEEHMFQSKYWKYVGMDEMAKFDVPAVVKYVCQMTGWSKVGYLGYSQGTAQMFMSLSLSEEMNERVACFVAMAPAMRPRAISKPVFALADRFSPAILYGLGWWSFLPLAEWLRRFAHSEHYSHIIHNSLQLLLGWNCTRWPAAWRPALYSHLFGGGSVRNVVHWFEIMTKQTFGPYEHERAPHYLANGTGMHPPLATSGTIDIDTFAPANTGPCAYPTKHIRTKMVLFSGTKDEISEPEYLRRVLPEATTIKQVDGFGHMDFLWDPTAKERVWDDIVLTLREAMEPVRREVFPKSILV